MPPAHNTQYCHRIYKLYVRCMYICVYIYIYIYIYTCTKMDTTCRSSTHALCVTDVNINRLLDFNDFVIRAANLCIWTIPNPKRSVSSKSYDNTAKGRRSLKLVSVSTRCKLLFFQRRAKRPNVVDILAILRKLVKIDNFQKAPCNDFVTSSLKIDTNSLLQGYFYLLLFL
jgi:hypothetical protein